MSENTFDPKTVPSKENFIKELNGRIPGWNLAVVNDMTGKTVFALTIEVQGPLMIGDEMGINDPIIPITDHASAFYGFTFGTSAAELPDDPQELKNIWDKSLETYEYILQAGKDREYCPACMGEKYKISNGNTKGWQICQTCFGLGYIYAFGPQKKLGISLIRGAQSGRSENHFWAKFTPDALQALFGLYDAYHTGLVTDIAQDYLPGKDRFRVIQETFPGIKIYYAIDDQVEAGLGDFVYLEGKTKFQVAGRHFYYVRNSHQRINLHSGKVEIKNWMLLAYAKAGGTWGLKDSDKLHEVKTSEDMPGRDRWNVTLNILRNLCKYYAK